MLVAAVSDGAGSAAHSELASRHVVGLLLDIVELYFAYGGVVEAIDRETVLEWLDILVESLTVQAGRRRHRLRDYACTLLVAIVARESAVFFQIGDGAIVVSHGADDGWSYVFWPQHGEYANSTTFVVSVDAQERLMFEPVPRRIGEIALFSDGIENLVLHNASRSVHGPFFDKIMGPVRTTGAPGFDAELSRGLEAYLSSPLICERTDDDKSLILATRIAQGPGI